MTGYSIDKPARLRFVKLNQNNYKYWDGNAVYLLVNAWERSGGELGWQVKLGEAARPK